MDRFKHVRIVAIGLGVMLPILITLYSTVTSFAAEFDNEPRKNSPELDTSTATTEQAKSTTGNNEKNDHQVGGFPPSAFEYAKMVEADLGEGVELPRDIDGVQARGNLSLSCDNPSRGAYGHHEGQRHHGRGLSKMA